MNIQQIIYAKKNIYIYKCFLCEFSHVLSLRREK